MSEPNLKEMTQEELLKYLEQDFMPRVLDKLAENARLKAEVTDLKSTVDGFKAEVERLTAFTTRTIVPNKILQAQVERLTKAGDELHAFLINYIVESRISSAYLNKLDDGWEAAKEGKGQP